MKKIVLLLAAISLVSLPAYAAVQNVKIGGDLTMLGILRNNFDLRHSAGLDRLQSQAYQDDRDYFASIIRIRLDADLTENVTATLRLINERDWDGESTTSTDIDLDLAYVTLKEFMMSPLTVTVGRQEIHFGNDLIVGDPSLTAATGAGGFEAADLSLRKGFDAVRLTYDLSDYVPVTVDAIYAVVDENTTFLNDDTTLYGVNARYDLEDYNALAEGYYFAKKTQSSATGNAVSNPSANSSKAEYIHNLGLRGSIDPIEDLNLQLEGAYQFGDYAGGTFGSATHQPGKRSAWATQAIATYKLPVLTEYSPLLKASYTYLSGEDESKNADGKYKAWDPMYENQNPGNILNALFYQTGFQGASLTASVKPIEDLTLSLNNVYAWFTHDYADGSPITPVSPTYSDTLYVTGKSNIGWESDVILTYDYTEDVQLGLTTGAFFPGNALEISSKRGSDDKGFNDTAWEAIASMKVTF